MNENEFVEKDQPTEVKWIMGLFYLLIGKKDIVDFTDPENTWKLSNEYLKEIVTSKGIGGVIRESVNSLDFSSENLYRMKRYLGDQEKRLESAYYENISPLAGILAPFVKEGLERGGVINPTPQHKYQEAQYIFDIYSENKDKIASLAKKLNISF